MNGYRIEFPDAPRFVMKDEDRVTLATDQWERVLGFINDGER